MNFIEHIQAKRVLATAQEGGFFDSVLLQFAGEEGALLVDDQSPAPEGGGDHVNDVAEVVSKMATHMLQGQWPGSRVEVKVWKIRKKSAITRDVKYNCKLNFTIYGGA